MIKKFLGVVMVLVLGIMPMWLGANIAMAEGSCVKTAILSSDGKTGEFCENDGKNGNGILSILIAVVRIMTMGVGILGIIGIMVVGIQYLTAGGSEEKVRTAKRRMFEIVLGLIAYALIYAVLSWLLPGFGALE